MYWLTSEGIGFILRWLHLFAGIIWIGLLYYFNFVHGSFMAEADAQTKPGVVQKLLPRALWWFRWAAMWTMITGVAMLGIYGKQYYSVDTGWTSTGVIIIAGSIFALTMFANVWLVIWPNQKKVIAGAPDAAAAGAKALLASRTNVLFSIPMLLLMLGARHMPIGITPESNITAFFGVFALIWAAIEANALKGKLGPMAKPVGVIHMGVLLTVVVVLALEFAL